MAVRKEIHKRKIAITEIGQTVPGNFKFGIIVAVAILWAEFIKSLLNSIFSLINFKLTVLSDLVTAILATIIGYFVLISYRKIRDRLKKVKV